MLVLHTDEEPIALTARNAMSIPTFTERAQHILPMTEIKKDTKYTGRRPNLSPKLAHIKGKRAVANVNTESEAFMAVSVVLRSYCISTMAGYYNACDNFMSAITTRGSRDRCSVA